MTGELPNLRAVAERVATTVLTINATAKHPGTIDPHNAQSYSVALREAAAQLGLPPGHDHVVAHLTAVLFDLAEFSAARQPEQIVELVQAFAHHLQVRPS